MDVNHTYLILGSRILIGRLPSGGKKSTLNFILPELLRTYTLRRGGGVKLNYKFEYEGKEEIRVNKQQGQFSGLLQGAAAKTVRDRKNFKSSEHRLDSSGVEGRCALCFWVGLYMMSFSRGTRDKGLTLKCLRHRG